MKFHLHLHYYLTVNELQQSLLYDSVTYEDIGCIIALDIQCGSFPFTLGKVVSVTDTTVTFDVFINLEGDLNGIWTLSKNLRKTYSKDLTIRKKMSFLKDSLLKKGDKKFLSMKYHL